MANLFYSIPIPSVGWMAVWRRNSRVWKKLMIPSLLGNFAEPLLYLVAIGYGLGSVVGKMEGLDYILFLATGIVCSNAMNVASFEGMYSAYARMAVQRTWEGMLMTPLSLSDIVFGEAVWAATKTLINSICILLVISGLGLIEFQRLFLALPILFLTGFCFAALALIVTSFAKSYDFFLYYFTLVLSPLLLLSGIFFPIKSLPFFLTDIMQVLPLSQAVSVIRPLLSTGTVSVNEGVLHLASLGFYAVLFYWVAVVLLKKRLMQ